MALIKSRPRLRKLGLILCGVTHAIVDTIADTMPDLQHLDLSGNRTITIPAMERLIKTCTKLAHLCPPDDRFFDGTYTFSITRRPWLLEQKELDIIRRYDMGQLGAD
ncbi:hypothetical protein BC941DRAFT_436296 [Chlamydoabsidia padenii]|nr:hypothetical protein BC941DRAFT_436296 [Chlamydoabsidia padenii]